MYYNEIFRRKSVRKYDETMHVSPAELDGVREMAARLKPLDDSIRTAVRTVPVAETTAKRGEYCLLLYSEPTGVYLQNAGYMLQQADLYFAAHNLGACWYGLAKPDEREYDGLKYTIMISFAASTDADFRHSVDEFKRHDTGEIWSGEPIPGVTEAVRLAPSACNTQPWRIVRTDDGKQLELYRSTLIKSIIRTPGLMNYFNRIDMGICMYHLETALEHAGITFERTLYDGLRPENNMEHTATYKLK